MAKERTERVWLLVVVAIVALALAIAPLVALPPMTKARLVARGAPLLGYQALFLSILSAAHPGYVRRLFGRSFLTLHHWVSLLGIALLVVHAAANAVDLATVAVLVPRFESARAFVQWGGSPSLYLLLLLTLIAFLKRAFRRSWRALHLFSYLAFYLATTHGLLLGIDFQRPLARAVILVMATTTAATPIWRRTIGRRRPGVHAPTPISTREANDADL